jgi:hypothetical protein
VSLHYTDDMSVLALAAPGTSAGFNTGCPVVFPMPSWPYPLPPQHLTPPPATMAHVWKTPVAMAMAETTVW